MHRRLHRRGAGGRGHAAGGARARSHRRHAHKGGRRRAGGTDNARLRARADSGTGACRAGAARGSTRRRQRYSPATPRSPSASALGRRGERCASPTTNARLRILAAAAAARAETTERARVHWRKARSLVGRLSNLAQALRELKATLPGGCAVAQPPRGGATGGWRRGDDWASLQPGGRAAREWVELLDAAEALMDANEGVRLPPLAVFPGLEEEGVRTITTDAIGVDGIGGYAFLASRDGEVWLV
eukprot:5214908-Pleurochrysis_carterae.AAC.4